MYSGTLIDDLIACVARAEGAVRGETEMAVRELPPSLEELNALCAHFLTDSQVMAGAA